jgi:hypothetical protein
MPDGTLELIVQIDPVAFRTIGPGDSINAVVSREVQQYIQQYRVSRITVAVENSPPERTLPRQSSAPASAAMRGASAAPARVPDGPASPIRSSGVLPANATAPLQNSGPSLESSGSQGLERVAPPTGPSVAPRTANEQSQGAADPRAGSSVATDGQGGNTSFQDLQSVDGGKTTPGGIDRVRLVLYLCIIGLAASNGYVGWLFYDARQRYITLLARKFAAAS